MKKGVIFSSSLLTLFAGLALNSTATAQPPANGPVNTLPAQPNPKPVPRPKAAVVDLQKPLPTQLDLIVGQEVYFLAVTGGVMRVEAQETDGKGQLLLARLTRITFNNWDRFLAMRAGSGEIKIHIRPVQGASATHLIKVTVRLRPIPTPCLRRRNSSGVKGSAKAGRPIHAGPGGRPGVTNTRALPGAHIVVLDAITHKEVAYTTTDSNGEFNIPLPPGKYNICASAPKMRNLFSQNATVTANSWQSLTFLFDTF